MQAGFDKTSRIDTTQTDLSPVEHKTVDANLEKSDSSRVHTVTYIETPSESTVAVKTASARQMHYIPPFDSEGSLLGISVKKDVAPLFFFSTAEFSKYVKADAAETEREAAITKENRKLSEKRCNQIWEDVKFNFKCEIKRIERIQKPQPAPKPSPT